MFAAKATFDRIVNMRGIDSPQFGCLAASSVHQQPYNGEGSKPITLIYRIIDKEKKWVTFWKNIW